MPFILRKTITETFLARIKACPHQIGFQYKPTHSDDGEPLAGPSKWKTLTFREFHEQCRLFSFGLMGLGIRPGDKVALLSQTRIEWSLLDMAILGARAVTVPIYPSNASDDVVRMLNHSEARIIFVENAVQLEKILRARHANPLCLPALEKIIAFESGAMRLAAEALQNITSEDPSPQAAPASASRPRALPTGPLKDVLTLQALRELGRREEGKNPQRFDENLAAAQPEDVFTICYTTGTTGEPKGVPLTHGNLMSVIEDCLRRMERRIRSDREVILAFLPFSHVLGRVESMIFYSVGGKLAFAETADSVAANLLEIRPTFIFAVPRIFERAFNQIQAAVDSESVVTKKLFRWALDSGRAYHEAFWRRRNPSMKVMAQYVLARNLVFRRITERFGGRLRYAICGGAPLNQELGEFFEIAGIRILEGYGLTETCAPVTLNDPDRPRFGTVGKPLDDVQIKFNEDGEILVRSRKVFHGYYKDPSETERVLRDGWFHTGDIGYLDRDGYLHITDRKKDIIITSGGKNIAPQKVENLAKTHPLIREIVVYGDRRNYLTALLTLNRDTVIEHANAHQILFSDYISLIKNPKILQWVERTLDEVNHQLASYERIRKFMILPHDFSVEGGELTASLKVRRKVIYERYKDELDSLY